MKQHNPPFRETEGQSEGTFDLDPAVGQIFDPQWRIYLKSVCIYDFFRPRRKHRTTLPLRRLCLR